ncbi:MAG TPA: hypothetical protein VH025_09085, partial [Solirubrobacteraceae bacterium]|nr:hypothetical protein [Solirubrobacteraceae bacterium]
MSTGFPSSARSPVLPPPPSTSTSAGPAAGERRRWRASPELSRRELSLVALAGVAIALLTTWPLALHMGSRISPDLGDPVRT